MPSHARHKGQVEFVGRITAILAELRAAGVNAPDQLADVLNVRAVPPPNGKRWTALQVLRIDSLHLGRKSARFPPNLDYAATGVGRDARRPVLEEHAELLRNLACQPGITLARIQASLADHGVEVSALSTISRTLKRLGISTKYVR
ncbi:hypothetical protein [Methylobacterium nigriterrae]|uniref:hypothetical protein n=1 Tax=Methylobacterium nigriterrae TaxID=3127512 RepID=UPI003013EA80